MRVSGSEVVLFRPEETAELEDAMVVAVVESGN